MTPRVFISYSHDDDEQRQRILDFANRLRGDGIDARIDQFTPNPPEGWDYWMERQIVSADHVIAVVTPVWARRFDNKEPDPNAGKGVSHEARILRSWLYHRRGDQSGLLVATVDGVSGTEDVPMLLNRGTVFRYPSGYETIRKEILGQNAAPMAPLGEAVVASPEGVEAAEPSAPTVPAPPTKQRYDFTSPAEGDRFVGREMRLKELRTNIEQGRCSSIQGDRQIGKSSLLRELHRQLLEFPGAAETVRLLSGDGDEGGSAYRLVRAITGNQPPREDADAAATHLDTWAMNAQNTKRRPVILIDEFERVVEQVDDVFFVRLRGMLQNRRLVVLTVSRKRVVELFESAGKTSPFSNTLANVEVGLFTEKEAQGVIRWGAFASEVGGRHAPLGGMPSRSFAGFRAPCSSATRGGHREHRQRVLGRRPVANAKRLE